MPIRNLLPILILLTSPLLLLSQKEEVDLDEIQVNPVYRQEIHILREHPAVRRALQLIRETGEQTIQETIQLTEIPAPPFAEEVRAAEFNRMLEEIEVDSAWIDTQDNVIARRTGTSAHPAGRGGDGAFRRIGGESPRFDQCQQPDLAGHTGRHNRPRGRRRLGAFTAGMVGE